MVLNLWVVTPLWVPYQISHMVDIYITLGTALKDFSIRKVENLCCRKTRTPFLSRPIFRIHKGANTSGQA